MSKKWGIQVLKFAEKGKNKVDDIIVCKSNYYYLE